METNFKKIRCQLCKSELHLFVDSDNIDYYNIKSCTMWNYAPFSYDILFGCKNCPTYYVGCQDCSDQRFKNKKEIPDESFKIVLCQFMGYDVLDENYTGTLFEKIDEEDEDGCGYLNFSKRNQFYAHLDDPDMTKEHGLTGPDGGFCHEWKCHKCGELHSITDK